MKNPTLSNPFFKPSDKVARKNATELLRGVLQVWESVPDDVLAETA